MPLSPAPACAGGRRLVSPARCQEGIAIRTRHFEEPAERPLGKHEILGPVAACLIDELSARDIVYWFDSGSLLGLVRDGGLPPWDKDIDLGIVAQDVDAVSRVCRAVASRHDIEFAEKRLEGETYALLLRPEPSARGRNLPIAIHVFRRGATTYTSPQPHLLISRGAAYARYELGLEAAGARSAKLRSLIRRGLGQPTLASAILLTSLRLTVLPRLALRVLSRINRPVQGVVERHPSEQLGFAWLYRVFRWQVPASHLDTIVQLTVGSSQLPVPSRAEEYLAYRYGTDWRTPRQQWFYVLDDASLEHG